MIIREVKLFDIIPLATLRHIDEASPEESGVEQTVSFFPEIGALGHEVGSHGLLFFLGLAPWRCSSATAA